jgi:hypothetical protein
LSCEWPEKACWPRNFAHGGNVAALQDPNGLHWDRLAAHLCVPNEHQALIYGGVLLAIGTAFFLRWHDRTGRRV